jgi:hypothetical protein
MEGHVADSPRDSDVPVIKGDPVGAEPVDERGQQDLLQVAAMDGELGVLVPGEASGRLAEDELAEAVEERRLPGGDTDGRELVLEAEPGEDPRRMRQDVNADPNRAHPRNCLVDLAINACVV